MSRIYFHSVDQHRGDTEEVFVSGRARYNMSSQIDNIAWGPLESLIEYNAKDFLEHYMKGGDYLRSEINTNRFLFMGYMKTGFRSDSFEIVLNQKPLALFPMKLNTALRMGSDPVKLAARIHASCEIWTWFKGENRNWIADIIEEGLNCHFFRKDDLWENVVEFLRSDSKNDVVLSYSVCDQFPNHYIANINQEIEHKLQKEIKEDEDRDSDEEDWDDDIAVSNYYYDMTTDEQWDMAFKNLKDHPYYGDEIKPDNWKSFYYSHGCTTLDVEKDFYEFLHNQESKSNQ